MEVVALFKDMQDNAKIFELVKDDQHILYGDMRAIADIVDCRTEQIVDGKKLKGYIFNFVGRAEYIYEHRGFTGTRKEIGIKFNLNSDNLSSYISKDQRVGGMLILNGKAASLITLSDYYEKNCKEEPKKVKKRRTPNIVYTGENKQYVDSLFSNCFKGWSRDY